MFFRLCNSPRMFQAMMNEIFANMKDIYIVYINNLIIFTKSNSKEEHNKVMLEVLQCLEENDLFIKPEKCYNSILSAILLGLPFLFTDDTLVLLIIQCYHTITHSLLSQLLLYPTSLLDDSFSLTSSSFYSILLLSLCLLHPSL